MIPATQYRETQKKPLEYFTSTEEQYHLQLSILHWCQAGDESALVSEISTKNCDQKDIFI